MNSLNLEKANQADGNFTLEENNIIEESIKFAKTKIKDMHSSHGWDHVERVIALADKICATESNVDKFIVKTSAILHDISREEENLNKGKICHAKLGSKIAFDFLLKLNFDGVRAKHISDSILTHRFRDNRRPSTIEAKILFDADKLDSIGAVGIGRAFLFSGEIGAKIHNMTGKLDINVEPSIENTKAYTEEDTAYREYEVKLKFIKNKMLTETGKKIALERDAFMEIFFDRLKDEVKGVK